MKICVFGAGAVGGHIAGRAAAGGADVSVVARGAHLAAIRDRGLVVETPEGPLVSRPAASDDPASLDRPDIVIVAVKAPSLGSAAAPIAGLLGPETPVLFVMNGIPWWYPYADRGRSPAERLSRVDPKGRVWRTIGPERAVGGVAHTACTVTAPGVIHVQNPRNRLVMGRPDGNDDPVVQALAEVLSAGGLDAQVSLRIRDAVWEKVLMNLVGGSLGILTASPMGEAFKAKAIGDAADRMTAEAVRIAEALGCTPTDPQGGLGRLRTSRHRQSILQDLEAGRPMEVDALLTAPLDLARSAGIDTPTCDLIVALAVQRARAAGLYDEGQTATI